MARRGSAIREVRTHVLEARLKAPFAYSQAWYATRGAMLVEITTEDGVTGWGEAFGPARLTAPIVEFYAPLLIGARRDGDRGDLAGPLQSPARPRAEGPADRGAERRGHRLVGHSGKLLGQPVHVLMGGPLRARCRPTPPACTGAQDPDHERYLREEAAGYAAEGFGAMKLKTGFGVERTSP